MINIVIPMAGMGSRFSLAGYKKPKPFIDVLGVSMIERVLENLYIPNAKFFLITRKEHIKQENKTILKIKKKYNVTFILIDKITEGTACTVLFAKSFIDNNQPLIIANSDQIIEYSFKDFIKNAKTRNLSGSILTFIDDSKNPKWSYAKVNKKNIVVEVREKMPISKYATIGIYFFKKGSDFVDGAIEMIINNDRVNNEFYTCPVYNYLIKNKHKVGIYDIPRTCMFGTGTPEDLNNYITHLKVKC